MGHPEPGPPRKAPACRRSARKGFRLRDAASNLNAPVAGAGKTPRARLAMGVAAAVPPLDTARANTGTASAFVALLAELWAPTSMILFESVRVNGGWVGR